MAQCGGERGDVVVLGLEARCKALAWEQEEWYWLGELVELGLWLDVQQ